MANADQKRDTWEKEVRKIIVELIDPDKPLAEGGKRENEDKPAADEASSEEE